jgi:hypothetical protein
MTASGGFATVCFRAATVRLGHPPHVGLAESGMALWSAGDREAAAHTARACRDSDPRLEAISRLLVRADGTGDAA